MFDYAYRLPVSSTRRLEIRKTACFKSKEIVVLIKKCM
jgi:hypothetical protein